MTTTSSKEAFVQEIESFISFYEKFNGEGVEPMMNIVSCKDRKTGDIYVLILLRSKHRPDVYFADEPERLVISPASVDVGGKIITPRKEDFDRINEELIASVFDEVFVSKERLKEVFSAFVIRTVS